MFLLDSTIVCLHKFAFDYLFGTLSRLHHYLAFKKRERELVSNHDKSETASDKNKPFLWDLYHDYNQH
jgi:hypothetical protein